VSIFAQDAKNTITAVSETGALGQRIRLDLRYDSQETDISRRPVAIGFSVKLDPNLFTIEQVILPNSPFYYYQPNIMNQSHGVVGITWVLSSQTSGASLPSNYTVATLVVRVSPSALTPVQTTRQGLIEITGSPVVIDASDASARQQTLKPINGAVTIIRAWPTPDQYVVRVPLPKDPPAPKAPLPTLISEGGYYPNDAMRGNVSLRNAQSGTGTVYSAAGNLFLPQVPDSLVELSQYPAGYTAFTVGPVPIDAWTLPATGLLFDGTKHVVAESYYDVQSAGTFGVSFDGVVTGARMRVLAQFTGGTAKVVAELVILSSGVVQFSSFTSEFDFYLGGGDPLVTKGVPLLPGQQIATTTQPFGNRTLTITWVNKRPDVKVAVGYRVFPVPDPTDPNITTGTTTFVVGHAIVKRDSISPFPIVFNAKSLSGAAGTPSLKLIP
jgi:hypothetical protein